MLIYGLGITASLNLGLDAVIAVHYKGVAKGVPLLLIRLAKT